MPPVLKAIFQAKRSALLTSKEQDLIDFLLEFLRESAAGLFVWGLALVFPFRQMAKNTEFGWDVIAVIAVSIYAYVAYTGLIFTYSFSGPYIDRWYDFVETWPLVVEVAVYLLLADLAAYWAHRLLHTRPLWHSHAFHHSPKHLYVFSGARASFVHIVVLFSGPVAVLFLIPIYEAPLIFAAIVWLQTFNQHYIHSNLRFPFTGYLEYVFVTPRFHFVHHSVDRRFSDNNFGFVLSIWDRWFGTYVHPESVCDNEPLGIDYSNSKLRLLVGLPPPR